MSGYFGSIVRRVATAGIATFFLFEIATIALAGAARLRGDDELALRMRPYDASAADAAARRALTEGRATDPVPLARKAIKASPLDAESVTTLALAYLAQGNRRLADDLMQVAARSGWRSPPAQVWMIEAALTQQNPSIAVLRADALLRQNFLPDKMIALLRGLAADRGAGDTLAGRLAENPPWRRQFLADVGALTPAQYDAHEGLLLQLRRTGAALAPEETYNYLSHLIETGEPERAVRVWREIRGMTQGEALIEDSKFKRVADTAEAPSPFFWRNQPTPGLSVTRFEGKDGGAEVMFDGTGSAKALEQTLVLSPGRYWIEMSWAANDGHAGQSLNWMLNCTTGGSLSSMLAIRREAPPGLQRLSGGAVTVPATNCRAQRLEIWIENERPDLPALRLVSVSVSRR